MSNEQRQHPRYAIELDVEVTVDDVTVAGRTHDISRGGFCMQAVSPLPAHEPCSVKLALVFSETEFSEHLILPGTTVWCTPFKGSFQIGVRFAQLDAQSRSYLELFTKFLDGGEEDDDDTE